jgi:glycosyltransferase involved in cell wall biosynthesis
MRILFLTSGTHVPSSRFRVLQFVPYLRALGHRCVVAPSRPPKYSHYRPLGWRPSQRLRRYLRRWDVLRARLRSFDLVFLERELFDDDTIDLELRFRRVCRRMVLDIDDAIFLNRPEKFARLAEMCDGVIAGNDFLAEQARKHNARVTVVPTCVALEHYPQKPATIRATERLVIGWTGTASNLGALQLIEAPLRELAKLHQYELRVISDSDSPLAAVDLAGVEVRFVRWQERSEVRDLSAFDIGIMPLADTAWNRYKCGLKIIQYMAIGIPAVASPVGVNPRIIRDGENGYLAGSAEAWRNTLGRLLAHPQERSATGTAGRRTVEETYCVEVQVERLVTFLNDVVLQSGTSEHAGR